MKVLKILDYITDKLQQYILIVTGSAVCLLIMGNAVMRYVLKIDFFGAEEITMFFAFWLYFIGSQAAARDKTHINANMVSLFTNNEFTINIIELIKNLLSLGISGIVTVWCYGYIARSFQLNARSDVFKIPLVIAQLPIFLSFVFWTIYLVRDVLQTCTNLLSLSKGGHKE